MQSVEIIRRNQAIDCGIYEVKHDPVEIIQSEHDVLRFGDFSVAPEIGQSQEMDQGAETPQKNGSSEIFYKNEKKSLIDI